MDVVHPRCAGLDISKKDVKVCVRVQGGSAEVVGETLERITTWGATTRRILALRDHLLAERVSCVVMEATSDYWKPFYYLLEDMPGVEVMLVNAHHAKGLRGRKTDVSDAAWLAQLGAHGLIRASFVPPQPIRELRDLTRARVMITRDRGREVQRLEKQLEDAGIKLTAVATDVMGVSSRAMLDALIAGQRDPAMLAELAKGRLRSKIPELTDALLGRFTEHHAFMVQTHLRLIDQHTEAIDALTERIEVVIAPFRGFRELICSLPGISVLVADVITAETGGDLSIFPTPGHLASWAGVCPGLNESAGKAKAGTTRPGNKYLKGALGTAALSIARTKSRTTYLGARYRRIAARRGNSRAIVAVEHKILTAIWHMSRTGELYNDPGPDFYTHLHPGRAQRRAVRELEALGYTVTLDKAS
jgi:transposase